MSCTTTASGPASSMICAVRAQIAGWVRASRSRSAAGSPKTTRPRAGRSRPPSRSSTAAPNRSATAASAGVPGSTTSRATASASTTTAPSDASWADTVDLPEPIPPVRPTRSMSATLAPEGRRHAPGSARRAGKPPVATGPQRVGVMRSSDLPCSTIARRYSSQSGCSPGDAAEVLHQRLHGVRRVDDLAVAVDLHPRPAEVVGEHEHADPRVAAGVGRLGPLRVGRDDDAALRGRRPRSPATPAAARRTGWSSAPCGAGAGRTRAAPRGRPWCSSRCCVPCRERYPRRPATSAGRGARTHQRAQATATATRQGRATERHGAVERLLGRTRATGSADALPARAATATSPQADRRSRARAPQPVRVGVGRGRADAAPTTTTTSQPEQAADVLGPHRSRPGPRCSLLQLRHELDAPPPSVGEGVPHDVRQRSRAPRRGPPTAGRARRAPVAAAAAPPPAAAPGRAPAPAPSRRQSTTASSPTARSTVTRPSRLWLSPAVRPRVRNQGSRGPSSR